MKFNHFYIIIALLLSYNSPSFAASITPSHVYAQAERIHSDILAVKRHLNITTTVKTKNSNVRYKPQHVWQKTYEILFKLSIFRRIQDYPSIAVSTLEPIERIQPKQVYDQTRRILAELSLIKEELKIQTATPTARATHNKKPSDVYRLLSRISSEIDIINGQGFTPSHVFAQVIRLNHDIDRILHALNTRDRSYPPVKNQDSQPRDALYAGMTLMTTVTNIQRFLAIDSTDFSKLKKENVQPSDVYALIGLISSELQTIKYTLGLLHMRTPADKFYENKTPSDVEQLLVWCNNKLKQVNTTRF